MMKFPNGEGAPPAPGEAPDEAEPNLSLENTGSQTLRGLRITAVSSGYNPYDTTPGKSTATGMHRMEDMRRLSEWIRMKRDIDRGRKK